MTDVLTRAHVRTDWAAYAGCDRCGALAEAPCTDLAGLRRTGKVFERDRPHNDREARR